MPKKKQPEPPVSVVRIAIVDDHPLVREGLAARISQHKDLEVCGEAGDVLQGLALVEKVRPDVVIVDISLKRGCGLDLIRRIKKKYPQTSMLVSSMYDDSLYAERSIRAGASGYLCKQRSGREIIIAIRQVLEGKLYVSSEVSQKMLQRSMGKKLLELAPLESLSDRELRVYQLIGAGMDTHQIAKEINLSTKTVETYRERIKQKLGLESGAKLVRDATQWFLENG